MFNGYNKISLISKFNKLSIPGLRKVKPYTFHEGNNLSYLIACLLYKNKTNNVAYENIKSLFYIPTPHFYLPIRGLLQIINTHI